MNFTQDKSETICQEAQRLTHNDRNQDYGSPLDNFEHTASLWSAQLVGKLSSPLTAEEVGILMILFKVSRAAHKLKRDTIVDIAGYANCIGMVQDERKRRE